MMARTGVRRPGPSTGALLAAASRGLLPNRFRRLPQGEWEVIYEGRVVHLPELKGLHYLSKLLTCPGEEIHVRDLAEALLGSRDAVGREPVELERARKAVRNRIRDTISRIRAKDPELGDHLDRSVRTGTRCCYAPGRTVPWSL